MDDNARNVINEAFENNEDIHKIRELEWKLHKIRDMYPGISLNREPKTIEEMTFEYERCIADIEKDEQKRLLWNKYRDMTVMFILLAETGGVIKFEDVLPHIDELVNIGVEDHDNFLENGSKRYIEELFSTMMKYMV